MFTRILLIAALCGSSAAQAATDRWSGTAGITFDGTSTLHAWSGKVAARPFVAQVTTDSSGRPSRVQASVTVEVAKMDTAEAKRDENMRASMKAAAHPLIEGKIDAAFTEISGGQAVPVKLPMQLTLLGKPQKVEARISNWKLNGDKATFDLDWDLSLKACGIKVPSVMVVIRVGDTIKLHSSVTLKRGNS